MTTRRRNSRRSGGPGSRSVPGVLVAGTTSDAGKSFFVAGLCRALVRRGWQVQPFKAANMSLNSAVAEDGGEIAIAQWVQCRAARVPPTTAANPVLLKPEGASRVEVIVRGRTHRRLTSWRKEMPRELPFLRREVSRALEEARGTGRFVVAEGAGSPAEVNLKESDLSNFLVARALGAPVILVADLERGGALAQLVGTLALLDPSDRRRVKGLVLNRMRGDPRLLDSARVFLEKRTGVPVLGVLPFWTSASGARLPEEDSLSLPRASSLAPGSGRPRLGILRLPFASNFSDFGPLSQTSGIEVSWVDDPAALSSLDALLLPGSRRTRDDLAWMEQRKIPDAIREAWDGGRGMGVAGVCGGYQMLGELLEDPHGFEAGKPGKSRGLGLLPIATRFEDPKVVRDVRAVAREGHPWLSPRASLTGYEVRRGRTRRSGGVPSLFTIEPLGRPTVPDRSEDGARSADGSVWGTALHGILVDPLAAQGLARWVAERAERRRGKRGVVPARPTPARATPPGDLDTLLDEVADHLEAHLDVDRLASILGRPW